jgi:hypothetical protein
MTSKPSTFKILPIYLQPRILSAVSYIHQSPNKEIGLERINKVSRKLSDREMLYVLSLLAFDNLLDLVKDSEDFKKFALNKKQRTIH